MPSFSLPLSGGTVVAGDPGVLLILHQLHWSRRLPFRGAVWLITTQSGKEGAQAVGGFRDVFPSRRTCCSPLLSSPPWA